MMKTLRGWWDAFTGAGEHAVTVPPMDGPLLPNTLLEGAERLAAIDKPDSLCVHGGRLLASSGTQVLAFDAGGGAPRSVGHHAHAVTALASDGQSLAVALADGTIEWIDAAGVPTRLALPSEAGAHSIMALLVEGDRLLVANGSAQIVASDWKRDLMQKGSTGSLWQFQRGGEVRRLAKDLAFPYGLARLADGRLACSESWRHRIVEIGEGGRARTLLADLPAYPSRLSPASGGGFWLAAFAPRTQMVEFMLREDAARRHMIETIDPDYWMAPRHASGRSFREPLQGGGIKHLGILKPWAPSQSYGLVARLDAAMQPLASYHSRADGTIHGVTSCVEFGGRIHAASKGAECLVACEPDQVGEAA